MIKDCFLAGPGVPVQNILTVIGAVCLSGFLASQLLQLWRVFRLFVLPFGVNLRGLGQWAVVTGATDGIGKAYVEELARKGLSVLLISRTESKLAACVAEMKEKFPKVDFASCAVDFSGGEEVYRTVKQMTSGKDIGVLINNVGVAAAYPKFFCETSDSDLWRIINVNVAATTFMTHLVLPGMLEKKRGAVVNVASLSGLIANPLHTVYGSTKAFVDFFTRGLEAEYSGQGVYFQCLIPAFVATNMSKIRKPTFFSPSPRKYVRQALGTIGLATRTHGYWPHSLQAALLFRSLIPSTVAVSFIKRLHLGIRTRAIRKAAQRQEGKKQE